MRHSEERFAPYAAPENVIRVLDRVRKGGVKIVSEDYLLTIGINGGMVSRTLRALEFLGFRESDGTPTVLLERFKTASDEDAQAVLQESIKSSYDWVFAAGVDPSAHARREVEVAFRTREPSGQWTRMVTMFLGLCVEAGLSVQDTPTRRPGKTRVRQPMLRQVPAKTSQRVSEPVLKPSNRSELAGNCTVDPSLQGLIARFPAIKSVEDLDRWYLALKTVFAFLHSDNDDGAK